MQLQRATKAVHGPKTNMEQCRLAGTALGFNSQFADVPVLASHFAKEAGLTRAGIVARAATTASRVVKGLPRETL